jgi:hypothetical protein
VSARRYLEESLRLYRDAYDEWGERVVLGVLELVASESGDGSEALRLSGQSEALARQNNDRLWLSDVLTRRAIRVLEAGERRQARELLHQSLRLLDTQRGGYREGDIHLLLAIVDHLDGDVEHAVSEAEASLTHFSELGDDWVGQWDSVDVLAAILATEGELETGVRVYSAVSRHRETRGEGAPRLLRRVREQTHGSLERALASPDFAATAAEGRRLSLREAISLALTASHRIAHGAREAAD